MYGYVEMIELILAIGRRSLQKNLLLEVPDNKLDLIKIGVV